MKQIFKIVLVSLMSSIFIIGFLYYKLNKPLNTSNVVTVFQVGVYKNLVNANKIAKDMGGIVYKDDDLYRVYVAAYKNEDVINKMKDYYDNKGITYHLKQMKVNEEYINILQKYENMLEKSSDNSIYDNLNELLISSLEGYL